MPLNFADTSDSESSLITTDAFTVLATVGLILVMSTIIASDMVKVAATNLFKGFSTEKLMDSEYFNQTEPHKLYRDVVDIIKRTDTFKYERSDQTRYSSPQNISAFIDGSIENFCREQLWAGTHGPSEYIDMIYNIEVDNEDIIYLHRMMLLPSNSSNIESFGKSFYDIYSIITYSGSDGSYNYDIKFLELGYNPGERRFITNDAKDSLNVRLVDFIRKRG